MKRVHATVKQLKQLARAMDREATICQRAADVCVDNGLHAKNAKRWRGRSRTCWRAIALLEQVFPAPVSATPAPKGAAEL